MTQAPYRVVVGLEVHVQLLTQTKLFCRCLASFGDDPNTHCCPVCLGLPGALPVMNRRAIALATKTGVALDCKIAEFTKWDRKQYFYPDLPKGYQISQFDLPIAAAGYLDISDPQAGFEPKRVRIRRAHLEEDAGKSMHDEQSKAADSRVDLNRAGTPLLEIVTEPDLSSPEEAKAFLRELKLLLTYIEVSDCNMQEGNLRVDANINLHVHDGEPQQVVATPIVEVKNMNSFRAVERALLHEIDRQWAHWQTTKETAEQVSKQTRGWIDAEGVTVAMRTKEESSDYRYFPDPDLVPITQSVESIAAIRAELGELPAKTRQRLETDYGLSHYDADVLVNLGQHVIHYFEDVVRESNDAKAASNWLQRDVARWMKETNQSILAYPVPAEQMAALIVCINSGELNSTRAVEVLAEMACSQRTVNAAMESLGVRAVNYADLENLCRTLLAANPKIVQDVKAGKDKAIGALIGQARQSNPNIDPSQFRASCLKIIREL